MQGVKARKGCRLQLHVDSPPCCGVCSGQGRHHLACLLTLSALLQRGLGIESRDGSCGGCTVRCRHLEGVVPGEQQWCSGVTTKCFPLPCVCACFVLSRVYPALSQARLGRCRSSARMWAHVLNLLLETSKSARRLQLIALSPLQPPRAVCCGRQAVSQYCCAVIRRGYEYCTSMPAPLSMTVRTCERGGTTQNTPGAGWGRRIQVRGVCNNAGFSSPVSSAVAPLLWSP